jgi:Putative restriction endonuclease
MKVSTLTIQPDLPPFGGASAILESMSTKVLMDASVYLRTSFDGPDCEYLDGEIVERNMGEIPHSDVQSNLIGLLRQMRGRLGLRVMPEIRIQISPTRYRVADLAVWRNDDIGTDIPTVARS